jgi:hypothetical protein
VWNLKVCEQEESKMTGGKEEQKKVRKEEKKSRKIAYSKVWRSATSMDRPLLVKKI